MSKRSAPGAAPAQPRRSASGKSAPPADLGRADAERRALGLPSVMAQGNTIVNVDAPIEAESQQSKRTAVEAAQPTTVVVVNNPPPTPGPIGSPVAPVEEEMGVDETEEVVPATDTAYAEIQRRRASERALAAERAQALAQEYGVSRRGPGALIAGRPRALPITPLGERDIATALRTFKKYNEALGNLDAALDVEPAGSNIVRNWEATVFDRARDVVRNYSILNARERADLATRYLRWAEMRALSGKFVRLRSASELFKQVYKIAVTNKTQEVFRLRGELTFTDFGGQVYQRQLKTAQLTSAEKRAVLEAAAGMGGKKAEKARKVLARQDAKKEMRQWARQHKQVLLFRDRTGGSAYVRKTQPGELTTAQEESLPVTVFDKDGRRKETLPLGDFRPRIGKAMEARRARR